MGEPSVKANAKHDVLPDEIPVMQYLGGADPHDPRVSVVYANVHRFPTDVHLVRRGGDVL